MRPLLDAGLERVRNGETTLEEIDRELGEPDAHKAPATGLPHVLIAEDDNATRAVARAVLANNGFRVSEAVDGVDALEKLDKLRDVSVLVLDLGMPRKSGQEVLQQLRSSVATATLPIVVLTGAPDEKTEIETMAAGATDYVRKPLEPGRFVARVKAALRRAER
jgi:DNA-binding response OmpR family regulator